MVRKAPFGRRLLRRIERQLSDCLYTWFVETSETSLKMTRILQTGQEKLKAASIWEPNQRSLPSDITFIKTLYFRSMFIRYALAARVAKGKPVLETCSGLGWGAYLLESVVSSVTCVELEKKAISLAQMLWPFERTCFVEGSVLALPMADSTWDIVSAMESVEHFQKEDSERYVAEIARVLRSGGWLVGSTPLARTNDDINREKASNPCHLHIYTRKTLRAVLRKYFRRSYVFESERFFIAKK